MTELVAKQGSTTTVTPVSTSAVTVKPPPFDEASVTRATRWTEALPLVDTTAVSVATAFVGGWVSRFGVPLHVVTDRGAQFESELFSELSSIIGFHHMRTTSYHPQSNGIIERYHRSLKSAIRARRENWFCAVPIVLLGYRMTPNYTGFSPFTAVTGAHMMCPQPLIQKEYVNPSTKSTIQLLIKEMQSINFSDFASGDCHSCPQIYVPLDLLNCPKVWMRVDRVRKSLEAPYTGPYELGDGARKGALKIVCFTQPWPACRSWQESLTCGRNTKKRKTLVLTLASLNIRTLLDNTNTDSPERRFALVARELARYNFDIAALSETRLPDKGQLTKIGSDYTLFWSGRSCEECCEAGADFVIRTHYLKKLASIPEGLNDRLIKLQLLLGGKLTAMLISAYAPTMTNPKETKDGFYEELNAIMNAVPQSDKLIVLGDFNARVGTNHQAWDRVIR
ncbi:hypothetical protein Pcinc_007795 [Petrolisthes cinctipes]|uniref:Integrase catalytic domain-containing protein n=1 Tax=Petrolisthes cinctipes TaxID=88211 RepID=A0AAE1GAE3_PETCI|nr:hypothetical protein Pcinc_007795 [Petrolisthes cinctipes]